MNEMIAKLFFDDYNRVRDFCDSVSEKLDIKLFNIKTTEGLAESDFYDIDYTPSLVIVDDDEEEIEAWFGELPDVNVISQFLTQIAVRN